MVPRFGRDPESVPRCAPVTPDDPSGDLVLERHKRIAYDGQKPGPRQCIQLLLGIVEIVDVDDGETEILSAALDLIVKVAWRETVAAGYEAASAAWANCPWRGSTVVTRLPHAVLTAVRIRGLSSMRT